MATIGIALTSVSGSGRAGLNSVPFWPDSRAFANEAIVGSAVSQQSSFACLTDGLFWNIAASGGGIWVAFGPNPTASAGTAFLIPDGAVGIFAARKGDFAAVIDAS